MDWFVLYMSYIVDLSYQPNTMSITAFVSHNQLFTKKIYPCLLQLVLLVFREDRLLQDRRLCSAVRFEPMTAVSAPSAITVEQK